MEYKAKSSSLSLFMNLEILHIVNPWKITIDLNTEIIEVSKRNWFLIGENKSVIAFRFIRSVTINEHLFGGDIHIKVMGGYASAYYMYKKDLHKIKSMLMEYNQTKRGGIIFH